MYNLLLVGSPTSADLAAALAHAFSVPVGRVDVAEVDVDDRAWDSAVLCTTESVTGDVSTTLDISTSDEVAEAGTPETAELARGLAAALGTVVLYEAAEPLPSAYWLVTADGLRTRARLYAGDDEPSYSIDAVAEAVPQLPTVEISALPEVIREHRMPTPIRDGLESALKAERADGGVAESEAFAPGGELWLALTRLGAWEALTNRMARAWPPDGWYPDEYYREDLTSRDELELVRGRLTGEAASLVTAALSTVDDAFTAVTRDDDGASLAARFELARLEVRLRGWWWHRVPDPEPWR